MANQDSQRALAWRHYQRATPMKNSNSKCFRRIIRGHARWRAGVPPDSLHRIMPFFLIFCFWFFGLFSVFEGHPLKGTLFSLCSVPVVCWLWMQNWKGNLNMELLRYQPADINAFRHFQSGVLADGKLTLNRLGEWIELERLATGESYFPAADPVPAFTQRKFGPPPHGVNDTPHSMAGKKPLRFFGQLTGDNQGGES